MRQQQRKWLVHQRVAEDSTKKLQAANDGAARLERALEESRLREAAARADAEEVAAANAELSSSQAALLAERERTSQEVTGMRMFVAEVEKEKRKSDVMERFVRKHDAGSSGFASLGGGRRSAASTRSAQSLMRPLQDTVQRLTAQLRSARPELLSVSSRLLTQIRDLEQELVKSAGREANLTDALVEMQSAVSANELLDSSRPFDVSVSSRRGANNPRASAQAQRPRH